MYVQLQINVFPAMHADMGQVGKTFGRLEIGFCESL